MDEVRVNGEPLPSGVGLVLEMDDRGSRAYFARVVSEPIIGLRYLSKRAPIPLGARVTRGGVLVHVEGGDDLLRRPEYAPATAGW